jgi:hypothetical protein
VLAPHPFATLCADSLGPVALRRLLPWLDAVEICNAQNLFPWEDGRAADFARAHGITPYVGADAHIAGHLGACWQDMAEFDGPAGFLRALRAGVLRPGRFRPSYFAWMAFRHYWEKAFGRALRGFGVNVTAPDAVPAGGRRRAAGTMRGAEEISCG